MRDRGSEDAFLPLPHLLTSPLLVSPARFIDFNSNLNFQIKTGGDLRGRCCSFSLSFSPPLSWWHPASKDYMWKSPRWTTNTICRRSTNTIQFANSRSSRNQYWQTTTNTICRRLTNTIRQKSTNIYNLQELYKYNLA